MLGKTIRGIESNLLLYRQGGPYIPLALALAPGHTSKSMTLTLNFELKSELSETRILERCEGKILED